MSLLKNALVCMCMLIQMAFTTTPEEDKKEGFQWSPIISQQKQEYAPTKELSFAEAQEALLRALRRRNEEECAALLASGQTATNDPVIQSCDTLLNKLTANLEDILSTKWRENPEVFNPHQILEEVCKIEQDRENRRCMYNIPCGFDSNQMLASMMKHLEYAQRIDLWKMSSGYEATENKKMLERSLDPSYKPWLDPEWLAASQKKLDEI